VVRKRGKESQQLALAWRQCERVLQQLGCNWLAAYSGGNENYNVQW